MPRTYAHRQEYEIEFSEDQWEEIVNLGFEPFEIEAGEKFTRGQWRAIADMATGKAQRIMDGQFAWPTENGSGDAATDAVWAAELREIAAMVWDKFKPGDGQI